MKCKYKKISKISIIGHGVLNDSNILKKVMCFIKTNKLKFMHLSLDESKIAILFKDRLPENILEQLYTELAENM